MRKPRDLKPGPEPKADDKDQEIDWAKPWAEIKALLERKEQEREARAQKAIALAHERQSNQGFEAK